MSRKSQGKEGHLAREVPEDIDADLANRGAELIRAYHPFSDMVCRLSRYSDTLEKGLFASFLNCGIIITNRV
jgi:hypothetical protein